MSEDKDVRIGKDGAVDLVSETNILEGERLWKV